MIQAIIFQFTTRLYLLFYNVNPYHKEACSVVEEQECLKKCFFLSTSEGGFFFTILHRISTLLQLFITSSYYLQQGKTSLE